MVVLTIAVCVGCSGRPKRGGQGAVSVVTCHYGSTACVCAVVDVDAREVINVRACVHAVVNGCEREVERWGP